MHTIYQRGHSVNLLQQKITRSCGTEQTDPFIAAEDSVDCDPLHHVRGAKPSVGRSININEDTKMYVQVCV